MEPKVNGYVAARLGNLKNASNDNISLASVGAGVKYQNGIYSAECEAGTGNSNYAKIKTGVAIPIVPNLSFDASVGGQYTADKSSRNYYSKVFENGDQGPSWKAKDIRGYGETGFTYHADKIDVGVGVQAGIKTSSQPSLQGVNLNESIGVLKDTSHSGKSTQPYFTTKGFFNWHISSKLDLKSSLSGDEFNVGLVRTF